MKRVVVVLPTYNEKETLERFLPKVLGVEKQLKGYCVHVLISDSHSPDGTGEIAKQLVKMNPKVHFIETGPGLGVGLIEGHLYSLRHLKPDIMAQLDADGQVDVDVLPRLVQAIDEGYDLAIGSRFAMGGRNELSFTRRVFSSGASLVARAIMGPWNIKEVTNSARAFTPQLFKKINLDRLPWKEKSFIIQPAFLNEAVIAGAKYKEVPLVFKNRDAGYSKNKVINYIYDLITYAMDARLHKWGIDLPLFRIARRVKTLVKFSVVGLSGTLVDFSIYNLLINFIGLPPATSKLFSTELGIVNNFTWNHLWTFKGRKTSTNVYQKFGIYNSVSFGALIIAVLLIKVLHSVFGDGVADILGIKMAYYNVYFFLTIPPVMVWNFVINHFITWKHQKD